MLSIDTLLTILARSRRPLSAREIRQAADLPAREEGGIQSLLNRLFRQDLLQGAKGGKFSLPPRTRLVKGVLRSHPDGYAFVTPEGRIGADDIFVPARRTGAAINGDRVLLLVLAPSRHRRTEGRVVAILERSRRQLAGRLETDRRRGWVVPADPKVSQDIHLAPGSWGKARPGQMVLVDLDPPGLTTNGAPTGIVSEVLGDPDDPAVEVRIIAHRFGLATEFPLDVRQEAGAVPLAVGEEDRRGRQDLREIPFVTIDGESARDFDDAVAIRTEGRQFRLWVAIADVGHYVASGSALDREAFQRGTSVYFPGRAIPMLPEALSNGICSLNPRVERLVMTAELLFDAGGRRIEQAFYPAVIVSKARLTYTQAFALLEGGGEDALADFRPDLEAMGRLASILTSRRRERGSLDFDLPEAEIILDLRGRPENIVKSERNQAHRLIEEFMLAANEAVAEFLTERDVPCLYRIHEPPSPEKLSDFQELVGHFGYGLNLDPERIEPKALQDLLEDLAGMPEERMINQVLLRSMKQARYSPDNIGHFGLAASLYCHFTSPIRRYPDLVIHRLLRRTLEQVGMAEKDMSRWQKKLPGIGEQTSRSERQAMEAEREIVSLKKCQFMADKLGQDYSGWISGVQSFGFFVELQEYFVEGLVPVASLADDYYLFEPAMHRLVGQGRRRIFAIGDSVRVRVENVSTERLQIDFSLLDDGAGAGSIPGETSERRRKKSRRYS